FKVAFGGVSVLVPRAQLDLLATVPGVRAVYRDEILEPSTERSPAFIGAPRLWRDLGGTDSAGEGVVVGVLDTGIWPEHPSFSDPDPDGNLYPAPPTPPLPCVFGNTGFNPNDAPFTCNHKLIGARKFLNTYKAVIGLLPTEFDSARDDVGHGTHTTSTAAGNGEVASSVLGVPRGLVSGIAPRAHVIMYRVCADEGCFTSDSIAAVEQAIIDGVDVINFSIAGGSSPYSDGVELAFLDAYAAGVFVAASAGNAGPGADTVDHRGPWTTTVAASTTDRHFLSEVTLTAADASMLVLTGATVTDGISAPTPVVFPPPGEELCLEPFAPDTFSGEIVICRRGVNARVAKSFNVAEGGAGGLLLYNPTLQGLATDNHFIPSVHVENDAGQQLLDFMAAHTGVMATFTPGVASNVAGDVMASFSSRGGSGQTLGVAKPDITAPGVQILAGHSPLPATNVGGLPGELFQVIQGTSMSSPHVAGAAALLKDLWATWTPGQIKSALMTTALRNVVKEDGITRADAFDFGSGRINLRRAGDPGITFDEDAADYLALETHLWDANYPSLYLPANPGKVTVQRTARSQIPHLTMWRTTVAAPNDVKITVPRFVSIPGNGEATFDITVDARDVPEGETRFARIGLHRGLHNANFPITLVKRNVDVVLDKDCAPTSFDRGHLMDCTITLRNDAFSPATVHLEDRL
ncbi:MAG: S8 family serine peptidase, partial [Actinobacteria bacterium]|nr:S8 family serine peptidase [Actinomycetota bacterium]